MALSYDFGNNFAAIGLAFEDDDDFSTLIERALDRADVVDVRGGRLAVASDGNGAELWFGIDDHDNLVTLNPYFRGKSAVQTALSGMVHDISGHGLDATVHGWAEPSAATDGAEGLYPYLFDVVDWGLIAGRDFPFVASVGIAAFPWSLTVHQDETAYYRDTAGQEPSLAAEAFIPLGLWHAKDEPNAPPQATGWFTGRVREAAVHRNPWAGGSYGWALISSAGGTFDLMLDLETVPSPPPAGAIVEVQAWLSARVIDDTP